MSFFNKLIKDTVINRRQLLCCGLFVPTILDHLAETKRPVDLIGVQSNLGLRPGPDARLPGTWRAYSALENAGLFTGLKFRNRTVLPRLPYDKAEIPGTRIRNGPAIRQESLNLAQVVAKSLSSGGFPIVVGGDCSNVLGAMLGLRRAGGRGLLHLDGHSDFFHPGNYDTSSRLGSVAGMDLALATGRGEQLLTKWPGVSGSLVRDADVIQIGERESFSSDYQFHEIEKTDIARFTIQEVKANGVLQVMSRVSARLENRNLCKTWLHIDVDVLDKSEMSAVDSPGEPGLTCDELELLLRGLWKTGRIAGFDIAIYDPDLDPCAKCAQNLVKCFHKTLVEIDATML